MISSAENEERGTITYLERNKLDESCEGIGRNEANVIVGIAHPSQNGNNEEDNVGQDLHIEHLDDVCGRREKDQHVRIGRRRMNAREMSSIAPRR